MMTIDALGDEPPSDSQSQAFAPIGDYASLLSPLCGFLEAVFGQGIFRAMATRSHILAPSPAEIYIRSQVATLAVKRFIDSDGRGG